MKQNTKSVCLFFHVHKPVNYRRYRFFDIGNDHYYYDDYTNETTLKNIAEKSYLPANRILLSLAKKLKERFKVAFSITGTALEQFELYAPEVIESFRELAETGCVEFLSETYSHSLSSLKSKALFEQQVKLHQKKITELFGMKPQVFRNTEMIYSDEIGNQVYQMGYKGILTEGARHVLGWKSPNFLYVNALNPRLKVLMRNFKLSDDISFRFSNKNWSEYPLTAEKFIGWLNKLDPNEEVVNLFLSYETFGGIQPAESGIFSFLEQFITLAANDKSLRLSTPSEVIEQLQPVSVVSVTHPISWADDERDLTAWHGNKMQKEAFEKLYSLENRMAICEKPDLMKDWNYLQSGDHFYYMSTKYFSDSEIDKPSNPFESPFEAFINYMNILSDFKLRLNAVTPESETEHELAALHKLLKEKDKKIKRMESELHHFHQPEARKKSRNTKKKQ